MSNLIFSLLMLKKNGGTLADMTFLKLEYNRHINNHNEILYLL